MSNINNDGKAGLEKCLLENSQYFKSTFHDSDYFQTLNELLLFRDMSKTIRKTLLLNGDLNTSGKNKQDLKHSNFVAFNI